MNNRCNVTAQEARAGGPIFDRISDLVSIINDLEKAVEGLSCALAAITCEVPQQPKDLSNPQPTTPSMSELERRIEAESNRIRQVTFRIGHIVQTLRL